MKVYLPENLSKGVLIGGIVDDSIVIVKSYQTMFEAN